MCPTVEKLATALVIAGVASSLAGCDREVAGPEPAGPSGPHAQIGIASVPANDDFDASVVVTDLPFTDALDTSEATTAPDDPFCVGQGPTVWYTFTATEGGFYEANTFGSDYDTTLGAYTGSRGDLTEIACNDDSGALQSRVVVELQAGETVHFMVGAFDSGPGGNLVFTLQVGAPPPPPIEGSITIDRVGNFDPRTGIATIRGTLTCSRLAFVDLFGTLSDRIGRIRIEAPFSGFFVCEGSTPWEAQVIAENAYLVGGPAQVYAAAVFIDPFSDQLAFDEEETTVRLRGGPPARPGRSMRSSTGAPGAGSFRSFKEIMRSNPRMR